jgi:hypothetical protein
MSRQVNVKVYANGAQRGTRPVDAADVHVAADVLHTCEIAAGVIEMTPAACISRAHSLGDDVYNSTVLFT